MNNNFCLFLLLSLLLKVAPTGAQNSDFFINPSQYPYIQFDSNIFQFPGNDDAFEQFFARLDTLVYFGEGKLNVVHIGGSHLQADIYTHEIRKRLQTIQYGMNGGRGLVFPYKIAHTNNPENYRVSYKGSWEACKNTQAGRTIKLGITGIAVFTSDNNASISINPNVEETMICSFTCVRVFHSPSAYSLTISIDKELYTGMYDSLAGCSVFKVPESMVMKLLLSRPDSITDTITVYGISLENDNPGIVYNSIGVNGAMLNSFSSCELFTRQLTALHADLIIFSIGTNDGNSTGFDKELFRQEYKKLLDMTKSAAPGAAILLTVPNDCYLYKRFPNKNTAQMEKEIKNTAREFNCGVWDFYSIMGGYNSSETWHNQRLMRDDKIHFTKEGYILKGSLFVEAFLQAWGKNLDKRLAKNIFNPIAY